MTMLVLASKSAARHRLLAAAGVTVTIDPADLNEAAIKKEFRTTNRTADACALALATAKAIAVAPRHPNKLVIGADQILDFAGTWFDKPRDRADAREQLKQLRGHTHELVSAVTVQCESAPQWHHVERSRLTMRAFSDRFVETYLEDVGDRVFSTVGAYALEGLGAQLFTNIDGDYFAVLGLPLLPLLDHLRAVGVLGR